MMDASGVVTECVEAVPCEPGRAARLKVGVHSVKSDRNGGRSRRASIVAGKRCNAVSQGGQEGGSVEGHSVESNWRQ